MMVRKIRSTVQIKADGASESIQKVNRLPADYKSDLSKSFGPSQPGNCMKGSRSSSLLKQKYQSSYKSQTPLNKKPKNFLQGTTTPVNLKDSMSLNTSFSNPMALSYIESWLDAQLENPDNKNQISVYIEGLKKLAQTDFRLKTFVETLSNGIEHCFYLKSENIENNIIKLQNIKIEQLNSQINLLNTSIKEINREKINVKKSIKHLNSALNFMTKKGVHVEEYFQQFNEEINNRRFKESQSTSILHKPHEYTTEKNFNIPKLTVPSLSDTDFHQEFMSKVDEFSESWRKLIREEKSNS